MTMDGSKIQVNGQGTPKGASAVIDESVSQAPIIDDSLIADDHEGLPLISAVFSLARNGKTEEASISGQSQQHRRQCGPVVRALALKSGDPRFKTRSDHSLNLILVVPGSTSQLHF